LTNTVVLISSPTELDILNKDIQNANIFSFNIQTHKALEKNQIQHEIAENYLSDADKITIFDLTVSCYNWHEMKEFSGEFEFEGINLLSLLDTAELHQHLIKCLSDFLMIKRIIEKEHPEEIVATTKFSSILQSLTQGKEISIKIREAGLSTYLPWDKIQMKFNIGRFPISFYLSRSTYIKIKNTMEIIICNTLNLWHDVNSKKKSVLLLEFNPSAYGNLLDHLGKLDKNIILINRRRPAVWNLASIKILQSSNCKILNINDLLDETEKKEITSITNIYLQKLDVLWSKEDLLHKLFLCEGYSFWSTIKDVLIKTYRDRIPEYVSFLHSAKKILNRTNVLCIVSLNVIGETEKIILAVNNNRSHSIMLEHGFANYTQKLQRYDVLSNYPLLQDKIAVWGDIQKKYLLEHRKFDPKRIFVTGSPRHDIFFKKKTTSGQNKQRTVLLTIVPITNITGQSDTNLHIKFEMFVRELCRISQNLNLKLIVKLHPGQAEHNGMIIELFKDIDPKIPVYQLNPILNLIESCDIMININPESCDTSTVILEGLIMEKPIITVFLDDKYHEIEFVKDNATISLSDHTNLDKIMREILTDGSMKNNLLKNAQLHLNKYLANSGMAAKNFADIINSI